MLIAREKFYVKKVNKIGREYYGRQYRKRTVYWFLWVLPIFVIDKVVEGDFEKY